MGKNSRLKKDRRIIREKIDIMIDGAEDAKTEEEFFDKISALERFDYLVQQDKETVNNYMHKVVFKRINDLFERKFIDPGIEENKERFDKIYENKDLGDISFRDLSLFAIYMNEKVLEIKKKDNYKEVVDKLNDDDTVKEIMRIKNQNKEISELPDKDKELINNYVAEINKLIEMVNNEIVDIGDKIITKSKEFNKSNVDEVTFAESVFSAHIVAFNTKLFMPAVEEIEEYNKIVSILNSLLNPESNKEEKDSSNE